MFLVETSWKNITIKPSITVHQDSRQLSAMVYKGGLPGRNGTPYPLNWPIDFFVLFYQNSDGKVSGSYRNSTDIFWPDLGMKFPDSVKGNSVNTAFTTQSGPNGETLYYYFCRTGSAASLACFQSSRQNDSQETEPFAGPWLPLCKYCHIFKFEENTGTDCVSTPKGQETAQPVQIKVPI